MGVRFEEGMLGAVGRGGRWNYGVYNMHTG